MFNFEFILKFSIDPQFQDQKTDIRKSKYQNLKVETTKRTP